MSIGSLTMWNLAERERSREFQYLLHCVSLSEKHDILELLWKQHSDEMKLLESSVFTVKRVLYGISAKCRYELAELGL